MKATKATETLEPNNWMWLFANASLLSAGIFNLIFWIVWHCMVWYSYELFPAIFIGIISMLILILKMFRTVGRISVCVYVLALFCSLWCHVVSYRIVVIVCHCLSLPVRFYTNNSHFSRIAIIFRWNNSCGWLEILSRICFNRQTF